MKDAEVVGLKEEVGRRSLWSVSLGKLDSMLKIVSWIAAGLVVGGGAVAVAQYQIIQNKSTNEDQDKKIEQIRLEASEYRQRVNQLLGEISAKQTQLDDKIDVLDCQNAMMIDVLVYKEQIKQPRCKKLNGK